MKVIIFGLGNFGMSLALSLTETGNEVIGIDKQMDKVNIVKDKISHSICLDSTNELAYQSLPIKQTDIAVVAIGENEGAAIITTAILKKLTTARVISRSLSPIHDTVLQAMGITSIVHPEQEAALKLTNKLNLKNIIDSFKIDEKYSISEIETPPEFIGKSISDLDFRSKQRLNIITILREREKINLIGNPTLIKEVVGIPSADTIIQKNDVLVVFGLNDDISKICHKN
ncbi:TrkA family potassium uptake protein [Formosa sp. L2A11]|uniref:potassium channel family protein n=1 Tax=Formosa sp. L2A11 TaxID=2686363 RepID=UPI00131E84BB|nr:TrkA family potassium uptake protein [Formosa sp. L2A11]